MPENAATIGRYKIVSTLGKGGMGTVYKALDPVLDRHVALKIANPSAMSFDGEDENKREKCLKEARLAAQFIHPNIAITYDAGIDQDRFYMALEYVDGEGLHAHVKPDGLLPRIQVLEVLYNTCYALEYIHSKGYVHLDIKPSNIMLTRTGDVKLMDFGISRLLKDRSQEESQITGSLFYMSPEQSNPDGNLTCGTDIFSLGIVGYQLLTGTLPFQGETPYQVLYQVIHTDPPPLHQLLPDIPPDLSAVIQKAMSKKVEDRFLSAKEFAEALLPVIKGKDSVLLDKKDEKKIAYLKRLLLFRHFQQADLEEVLRISSWGFYARDSWIVEESANDRNIYILVLGRVTVYLNTEKKTLMPGDCIGETAVLHNMPRRARLKAETDCVIMAINANVLNQADNAIQVKFLKEFYMNKTLQLVEANLKLIQRPSQPTDLPAGRILDR